ncbi:Thiol-disulfide isomerase or thioredoxin [Tenacibaculum sp. MAR_2010_89]|uniref:TlpA family protein disulfide reductase n=1 Tax=Tenacibaculum sp. MAR_2010_89 TaxID=1250198 RepID=UPI0008997392|nr:TlpA disulfide reductase family protein [Tenacibaculum sp. MAR_2010_89]SEE26874.1 Thiol-disulfide isomerase or thioredoxin [Tenacibaculum sp. MAR_2010_89]
MKNILLTMLSIVAGFGISFFSINTYLKTNDLAEVKTESEVTNNKLILDLKSSDVQKSFKSWDLYSKKNIDLMSTFKALDENGENISKGAFLNLLRIGSYLPMKRVDKRELSYQLVSLKNTSEVKIKKSIKSLATNANHYFRMEGKRLPAYEFVDLNGVPYNKKDTKGKLLVLKCWFITCKVCVEEFPELNKLVDKYKDEKVAFVSLAFDEKDKLIKFLKTKTFKYPTIPMQKKYMSKKLKVKQYPTHVIVDTNGVIIKMVNNVRTLTFELDQILGK